MAAALFLRSWRQVGRTRFFLYRFDRKEINIFVKQKNLSRNYFLCGVYECRWDDWGVWFSQIRNTNWCSVWSELFILYIKTKTPEYKNIRRSGSHGNRPPIYRKKKKSFFFFPLNFYDSIRLPFLMFLFRRTLSLEKKKILFFCNFIDGEFRPFFLSYAIRIFGYGRLLF
jgi:hypothetical protein